LSVGFSFLAVSRILVFGWHTRSTGGLPWRCSSVFLYTVVGVYLLLNPVAGLVSLTARSRDYLFAKGILEFLLALRLRPLAGSGWLFIDESSPSSSAS